MIRIRGDHPFFGTLALFVELRLTEEIETAATDGHVLCFNPVFVDKLSTNELCGLVVHELLHAALQHVYRRRERDAWLWNIAADIVVNGMIRSETTYELPRGGVEMPKLADLSVEEVYEKFAAGKIKAPSITLIDLLTELVKGDGVVKRGRSYSSGSDYFEQSMVVQQERHWRAVLLQASAVARRINRGFGRHGLDAVREFDSAANGSLCWRDLLWQFMVATPYDFGGFDRRFIHRRVYLEEMIGESVEVAICIDTSGSIGALEIGVFSAEIQSILDAYPQITGTLFFADAVLHGPHNLNRASGLPTAIGGGGTSFVPFFDWVHQQKLIGSRPLCIYFTDGFGTFPVNAPATNVLWVVMPGGLETSAFPFGNVARILNIQ
jgi:predicted metal-dependent peptidase